MEHEFRSVDVLNNNGDIIGQKPRREIDPDHDIYHGVYVLLVTPGQELVLSTIPLREDLPNRHANCWGTTMATIRRHGETSKQAAQRGISRELFIDDTEPELLGETFERIAGSPPQLISVYLLRSEAPDAYSQLDIQQLKPVSRQDFQTLLEQRPEDLSPITRLAWQYYNKQLALR